MWKIGQSISSAKRIGRYFNKNDDCNGFISFLVKTSSKLWGFKLSALNTTYRLLLLESLSIIRSMYKTLLIIHLKHNLENQDYTIAFAKTIHVYEIW